jgi:hypothetical protein
MFGSKKVDRNDLTLDVHGEPLPADPQKDFIADAIESYPYGAEGFGTRSLIRIVVWTVMRMKERGLI